MMTVPDANLIKRLSGTYDLDLIRRLDMSGKNITSLGEITNCRNITELNISNNNIQNIDGIQELKQLQILNVSENQIINLPSLENLNSLHTLLLQGNQISNLEVVEILKPLPKLKAVHFRNVDNSLSNPVVNHPAYDTTITKALSLIEVLDGERISLREHASLRMLDKLCKELEPVELPPSRPWLEGIELSPETEEKPLKSLKEAGDKQEKKFKKLLFKCKVSCSDADEQLQLLSTKLKK